MMPDLPNVGWERDVESFREFFENPAFRTDGMKVYPTLVIRGTGLYELWRKGLYRNYQPSRLIDLVGPAPKLSLEWGPSSCRALHVEQSLSFFKCCPHMFLGLASGVFQLS